MFRVDTSSAVMELPAQNEAGQPGFFSQGNAATGLPATVPGQDWFNIVQEELMAIVLAAGLTPDKATTNQVLQAIKQLSQYAADTGEADAYVIALSPDLKAHVTGMPITFKAANANTGASTLNVNGLGAVAIKKNGNDALVAGDIRAGQLVTVAHDGTNYQVLSKSAFDSTNELVSNIKPVVNTAVNKLDIFTKSGGGIPSASNIISVAIPDGNGYTFRRRSAAYLSGTSQIVMADGAGYWGRPSLASVLRDAFLYAIWDGTGIVWALGGHSRLINVPTTTTVTDPDYLLLEASSTYNRSASHFCVCVGKIRYEYNTANTPNHTIQAALNLVWWGAYPGDNPLMMIVADEKPQGTNGGTFTNGAWRTRDLNVIRENNIPGAGLSENQITLPAGKYHVIGSAPGHYVNIHVGRLQNITLGQTLINGTNELAGGDGTQTRTKLEGIISIPASVIEIQHYCQTSCSTNGFGKATSYATEVYSLITFIKVG